mgnify:CR=1 FL=1
MNHLKRILAAVAALTVAGAAWAAGADVGQTVKQETNVTAIVMFAIFVGITLWTIGDGRWEPQNFPSFVVRQEELVWDWPTSSSNYKALRAQKTSALGAGSWENESSIDQAGSSLAQQVRFQGYRTNDGSPDYDPVKDDKGNIVKTADQVYQEDMDILLNGQNLVNGSNRVRVSRMRADLPQASLANDLSLQASADQTELGRQRNVTKESGQPSCPVYNGCTYAGQAPRDQVLGAQSAQLGGGACSTRKAGASEMCLGVGALVVCASFVARRRRQRS